MKRALMLALALSLAWLSGCGSSDEKPEGEGGQPESTGGQSTGPVEPQHPPLADSYAGKWQAPDDGAVLEVTEAGGAINGTLLEDPEGRFDRLELALRRQPGNLLVGTCKVTNHDLPECELKLELFAAEGGGLQGRRQVVVVDEDGSFLTFDQNPIWEEVRFGVTPPPAPEPVVVAEAGTPGSGEEPTAEEPTSEEPTSEEPSTDEPSTDEPSTEEPSMEEPSTEEPTAEEPPTPEEPPIEEPTAEEPPTPEEPPIEEPSTEQPTEEPSTEEPSTEEPSTEEPSAEEPSTEEPSAEEPGPDDPTGLETDPEARAEAERLRKERLERQKALAELRERRKSPEGLVRVLFEAIQSGDRQLFSNCLINNKDGQFLFGPDGIAQAKLTLRMFDDQVWGERAGKFPGAAKGTFVKLEGTEQQGKRAKEMRDATLVYTSADGQTRKVLVGYLMQVEDGSWKAYRPEGQE